jgi:hypothetical protein
MEQLVQKATTPAAAAQLVKQVPVHALFCAGAETNAWSDEMLRWFANYEDDQQQRLRCATRFYTPDKLQPFVDAIFELEPKTEDALVHNAILCGAFTLLEDVPQSAIQRCAAHIPVDTELVGIVKAPLVYTPRWPQPRLWAALGVDPLQRASWLTEIVKRDLPGQPDWYTLSRLQDKWPWPDALSVMRRRTQEALADLDATAFKGALAITRSAIAPWAEPIVGKMPSRGRVIAVVPPNRFIQTTTAGHGPVQ